MTWLAFRRHRTSLIIATGVVVALSVWMALVAHGFDAAPLKSFLQPSGSIGHYRDSYGGPKILRLVYQADAINLVLLALPCLLGVLLGVPLVAAELDDHTNRIAWTQHISRTRWLSTKWWVTGLPLAILSTFVVLITQWWSHHSVMSGIGSLFGPVYFSGSSRVRPEVFSVTGIVPVADTLFAFALGAAIGALVRRVSWAIVGTILVYRVVSLMMATTVRPNLAPTAFVASTQGFPSSSPFAQSDGGAPWYVGYGYQFEPGSHHPTDASATDIRRRCENLTVGYYSCLNHNKLQGGQIYQPASNYWTLQWKESAIYMIASAFLLLLGLWLVRRWRT
jgi:hypothetical protein